MLPQGLHRNQVLDFQWRRAGIEIGSNGSAQHDIEAMTHRIGRQTHFLAQFFKQLPLKTEIGGPQPATGILVIRPPPTKAKRSSFMAVFFAMCTCS